ncbi:MAG: phosphopantetheine-binding protein [Thermodesulfobacteriota bacterium]
MTRYAEIKEIIAKMLALDEEAVTPEAHLQDDLGADSLALLNLAEALTKRYGAEITGDDLVDIASVGELVQWVESKTRAES